MKIYLISHIYDIETESGDSSYHEDIIGAFQSENNAKEFVDKYSNPHVYDSSSLCDFCCGELEIKELDVVTDKEFNLNKLGEELIYSRNDYVGEWWE